MMTEKEKMAVVFNILKIICLVGCLIIIIGILTAPTEISPLLKIGIATTFCSAIPAAITYYSYHIKSSS